MTQDAVLRAGKPARALELAKERYALRRASRWPYALRGEQRWRFEGAERRLLLADLRTAWRERYPGEEPPRELSQIVDELRVIAMAAPPDLASPDELAAELLAEEGIGATPEDRGLSLVTGQADCPLPDGYTIPAPYQVAEDGVHLVKDDGATARVTWAWLFPVAVFVDPAGDQLVELTWRDGRGWVSRLVTMKRPAPGDRQSLLA